MRPTRILAPLLALSLVSCPAWDDVTRQTALDAFGRVDIVANRLVGMKSRGVYETPGGTIIYRGHAALEQLCLDRNTLHYKQQVGIKFAELVYNG